MKKTSFNVNGQKRELGWWAEILVTILSLPAVLLLTLACVLGVIVLLLIIGALVAIAPAATIVWKLSKRKEGHELRRTRRSTVLHRDL